MEQPVVVVRPTIVWWKSAVVWGVVISIISKVLYLAGVQLPMQDEKVAEAITLLAGFVGDAVIAVGRLSSKAQPLTLTEKVTADPGLAGAKRELTPSGDPTDAWR